MDPVVPRLENATRRRRRGRLFNHARIPVRMLVPNFVTLLGLCWGLTSIRMSIEQRWELALGGIVLAALLDGIDGRVARYLKASSRFGAELDSLADFVNFGVAPAILLFTWGFQDLKSLGWICVMLFALASALRLARFNVASDEVRPKWQSNYFTGMPTPAAAIVVLLPLYLFHLGINLHGSKPAMFIMLAYTLAIALLMVSSVPTYSGKLMGERIGREWVLPIFVMAIAFVACLVTYPYETLTLATLAYLVTIPLSVRRYRHLEASQADLPKDVAPANAETNPAAADTAPPGTGNGQVIGFKPGEPKR